MTSFKRGHRRHEVLALDAPACRMPGRADTAGRQARVPPASTVTPRGTTRACTTSPAAAPHIQQPTATSIGVVSLRHIAALSSCPTSRWLPFLTGPNGVRAAPSR